MEDGTYTAHVVPDDIRKDVGRGGEEIACVFLKRRGYKIIDRNYSRKWGEIDIIAEKEGTVRFVEVKAVTARGADFSREMSGLPEELVHRTKLKKVARTAALYMEEKGDTREYQIDVVGVIMNEQTRTARCRLFEQALEDNL
ncbi:MAG: YraN family protein [Candidatus Komeilibacteria bacterium]|nr:YraN family protein [Candidatus Komeilibacteria bacterium]